MQVVDLDQFCFINHLVPSIVSILFSSIYPFLLQLIVLLSLAHQTNIYKRHKTQLVFKLFWCLFCLLDSSLDHAFLGSDPFSWLVAIPLCSRLDVQLLLMCVLVFDDVAWCGVDTRGTMTVWLVPCLISMQLHKWAKGPCHLTRQLQHCNVVMPTHCLLVHVGMVTDTLRLSTILCFMKLFSYLNGNINYHLEVVSSSQWDNWIQSILCILFQLKLHENFNMMHVHIKNSKCEPKSGYT